MLPHESSGFKVYGPGLRVEGPCCRTRVEGSGVVQSAGFKVDGPVISARRMLPHEGWGFRVRGLFRVQASRLLVQGSVFRVRTRHWRRGRSDVFTFSLSISLARILSLALYPSLALGVGTGEVMKMLGQGPALLDVVAIDYWTTRLDARD